MPDALPIVLVPGLNCSARLYADQIPALWRFGPVFVADHTRDDTIPAIARRILAAAPPRFALAGLSMGGMQTLSIGIPNLEQFGYLGVYSSGIFGIAGGQNRGQPEGPSFEEKYAAILDDAQKKEELKVFWFATGKDDFLVETSRATVAMFKKHNFNVSYKETNGGHTWVNWREYLNEFAPMLFQ